MNEKPEALRLVNVFAVEKELCRLHAENERLREALALAERLAAGRLAMVEQLTGEVEALRRERT